MVISACINYMTSRLNWGWRFSLGFAVVPAALMTFGSLLISDTPSSLVERGKLAQAKQSLLRARGINSDIEAELADLVKSSEIAKAANREPFITIFERQYRPHLVMTFVIPIFHQLSGINIISFYAPVLFRSVGLGNDSALIAAIILGVCHLSSIAVSAFLVDRFGRRLLFMVGGIQMCLSEVCMSNLLSFCFFFGKIMLTITSFGFTSFALYAIVVFRILRSTPFISVLLSYHSFVYIFLFF